ncbi:hypothetical protein RJ55_06279 [Drechmeria coniospora]|nr:hypothetical protein RJ55_06279 [Drechmeria coniospora]
MWLGAIADEGQQLPPAGASGGAPSVMNFAAAESELFPGEEYTYLLTPSLPFEPDFFETFATLIRGPARCMAVEYE